MDLLVSTHLVHRARKDIHQRDNSKSDEDTEMRDSSKSKALADPRKSNKPNMTGANWKTTGANAVMVGPEVRVSNQQSKDENKLSERYRPIGDSRRVLRNTVKNSRLAKAVLLDTRHKPRKEAVRTIPRFKDREMLRDSTWKPA